MCYLRGFCGTNGENNDGEINFIKMFVFSLCMQSFSNPYPLKLNVTDLHFIYLLNVGMGLILVQNIYFVNLHCFVFFT